MWQSRFYRLQKAFGLVLCKTKHTYLFIRKHPVSWMNPVINLNIIIEATFSSLHLLSLSIGTKLFLWQQITIFGRIHVKNSEQCVAPAQVKVGDCNFLTAGARPSLYMQILTATFYIIKNLELQLTPVPHWANSKSNE